MLVPAHLKYLILTVMFAIASINFTRTTIEILNSSKRLDTMRLEVSALKTRKTTLEQEIAYANSADFIEEKARNQLGMVRTGEDVVVVTGMPNNAPTTLGTKVAQPAITAKNKVENHNQNIPTMWFQLFTN